MQAQKNQGRFYNYGRLILETFFFKPGANLKGGLSACISGAEPEFNFVGNATNWDVAAAPFLLLSGLVVLSFYLFGALVFTVFFLIALFFVWPTLWLIASAGGSVVAAFGPSLLSFIYALCMHLKIFASPYTYELINRLEALTLWQVAVCTSSYVQDGEATCFSADAAHARWGVEITRAPLHTPCGITSTAAAIIAPDHANVSYDPP